MRTGLGFHHASYLEAPCGPPHDSEALIIAGAIRFLSLLVPSSPCQLASRPHPSCLSHQPSLGALLNCFAAIYALLCCFVVITVNACKLGRCDEQCGLKSFSEHAHACLRVLRHFNHINHRLCKARHQAWQLLGLIFIICLQASSALITGSHRNASDSEGCTKAE